MGIPQVLTNLSSWLSSGLCLGGLCALLHSPWRAAALLGSVPRCVIGASPSSPSLAMVFQCELQSGHRAGGQAGFWCG